MENTKAICNIRAHATPEGAAFFSLFALLFWSGFLFLYTREYSNVWAKPMSQISTELHSPCERAGITYLWIHCYLVYVLVASIQRRSFLHRVVSIRRCVWGKLRCQKRILCLCGIRGNNVYDTLSITQSTFRQIMPLLEMEMEMGIGECATCTANITNVMSI